MGVLTEKEQEQAILGCHDYVLHYAYVLELSITPLSGVNRDDLYQAGMLRLVKSAKIFDPEWIVGGKEELYSKLWRYAYRSVLGAMIEVLRKIDPLTRSERRRLYTQRRIAQQYECIYNTPQQRHTEELPLLMGFEEHVYHDLTDYFSRHKKKEVIQQFDTMDFCQIMQKMQDAIKKLNYKEQDIIQKYYFENKRMVDVSKEVNLKKETCYVYHCEAKKKLKKSLGKHVKEALFN